jgi:uncharacterized protein (DUF1697 family)
MVCREDGFMAKAYCVFLRGINIGTIRIKMEDLRQAFVQMGFLNVQTKLSTGNVIVTTPDDTQSREELKAWIERVLSKRFGYEAYVMLRDAADIAQLCASARTMKVPEDCHLYALLCDDKNVIMELTRLYGAMPHADQEQWLPHTQGAFWVVPKGLTVNSEFGSRALGDPKYKSKLTSRNMNTVEKLDQRMQLL